MPASPHAHHSTWATAGLQLGQVAGPGQCPQHPESQPPQGTPETPSIRPSPGTSLLPGITCPEASCWVWPTRGLGRNLEAEAGRSNEAGVHPRPLQAGPCPPCAATAPRAGASSDHGCPPLGPQASVAIAPVVALSLCSLLPSTATQVECAIPCWDPYWYIFFIPRCLRQGSFAYKGEKYA